MALGLPLELLTGVVSLGLSMVGQIISNKMQIEKERTNNLIAALTAKTKAQNAAAARAVGNPGFAWTRRAIALSCVFSILVLPKLVAVFNPEVLVHVGYTEASQGLVAWLFGSTDTVVWKTATGFAITPLDTHTVASIIGLYFGSSTVKI